MSLLNRTFILLLLFSLASCFPGSSKYNTVFIRTDQYVNSTYLTLITSHPVGSRSAKISFLRELKGNEVTREEINIRLDLLVDDPDLGEKSLLFANNLMFENPIIEPTKQQINEVYTTTSQTYGPTYGYQAPSYGYQAPNNANQPRTTTSTHSYNRMRHEFKLQPSPELIEALKASPNFVIRVYYGAEAADIHFDEKQLSAAKRYFLNQYDKVKPENE